VGSPKEPLKDDLSRRLLSTDRMMLAQVFLEAAIETLRALAILDRLGTLQEPDRLRYELAAEPV
jgi:hypothetical protein